MPRRSPSRKASRLVLTTSKMSYEGPPVQPVAKLFSDAVARREVQLVPHSDFGDCTSYLNPETQFFFSSYEELFYSNMPSLFFRSTSHFLLGDQSKSVSQLCLLHGRNLQGASFSSLALPLAAFLSISRREIPRSYV